VTAHVDPQNRVNLRAGHSPEPTAGLESSIEDTTGKGLERIWLSEGLAALPELERTVIELAYRQELEVKFGAPGVGEVDAGAGDLVVVALWLDKRGLAPWEVTGHRRPARLARQILESQLQAVCTALIAS
jgi:hypothetical protein